MLVLPSSALGLRLMPYRFSNEPAFNASSFLQGACIYFCLPGFDLDDKQRHIEVDRANLACLGVIAVHSHCTSSLSDALSSCLALFPLVSIDRHKLWGLVVLVPVMGYTWKQVTQQR